MNTDLAFDFIFHIISPASATPTVSLFIDGNVLLHTQVHLTKITLQTQRRQGKSHKSVIHARACLYYKPVMIMLGGEEEEETIVTLSAGLSVGYQLYVNMS